MSDLQLIWAEKQYALEIDRLRKVRALIDEQIAALEKLRNQLKQPKG